MKAFGSLALFAFLYACSTQTVPKPYVPDFSDITWELSLRKAERYEIEFSVERFGETVEVRSFVGYVKPYTSLISGLRGEEFHLFFSQEPSFLMWWKEDEKSKEKRWLALQDKDGEWQPSRQGAIEMSVGYDPSRVFQVLDVRITIETEDGKRISHIFKNDGAIP